MEGHCRFVGVVRIKDGHYKETALDGVDWAVLAEFSGKSSEPQFAYSAYYIDADATEAQKEALRQILSGPPFSTLGEQLGVKEAALDLEETEEGRYRLSLGELGEFSVAVVYGNDRTTPQKVVNPVYPFPAAEIIVGVVNGRFSDHGKDVTLEDRGAELSEFTLTSS